MQDVYKRQIYRFLMLFHFSFHAAHIEPFPDVLLNNRRKNSDNEYLARDI